MARKTNRQVMTERKARMLTAGQLMDYLAQFPKDTPIGKVGHFGEFHEMQDGDFYLSNSYITPTGSWRDEQHKDTEKFQVIDFYEPEIGQEPS